MTVLGYGSGRSSGTPGYMQRRCTPMLFYFKGLADASAIAWAINKV
jgi:hypothetical protein